MNYRELFNEPEGTKLIPNPIIGEIFKIFEKYLRKIKLHKNLNPNSEIKDARIISGKDNPFEDSAISIELNYRDSDNVDKSLKRSIDVPDFKISPIDVLLSFAAIKSGGGLISFPIYFESKKGNDDSEELETLEEIASTIEIIENIYEILFIKVIDRTSFVFFKNGTYYQSTKSLKHFWDELEAYNIFEKIQNSYIVNLKAIKVTTTIDKEKYATIEVPDSLDQIKMANDFNQAKAVPAKEEENKERLKNIIKSSTIKGYYFKIPISREKQKDIFDIIQHAKKNNTP